jgi:hypothetical protein
MREALVTTLCGIALISACLGVSSLFAIKA